ncbi:hypothetical protein Acsp02_95340 [Actinoplanes sp. NBRC 103695]|nr:hypothetical protein Acsp02_95340 [Actinoplanes sp. NBRC 103695]
MQQSYLVVSLNFAVAISGEDRADPCHSEFVQLGCAQCSHACCTQDADATIEQKDNFLVSDGTDLVKVAIDDPYDVTGPESGPQQITGGDRRHYFDASVTEESGSPGQ